MKKKTNWEELATIMGCKKKWYEEKRDKKEWYLGFRGLVISGTNGWSDCICVWFHDGKKLYFLEPELIDGLWDDFDGTDNEFDEWLVSSEGHSQIEESLYCLLEAAECSGDKNLYVEE